MPNHLPGWVKPELDLGPAPAMLPLDSLRITLRRAPAKEAAFQQLLIDQQDAGSTRYQAWLTPQQIGEEFGLDPADVIRVTEWLQSQGFSVDSVANSRMFIVFHGRAEDAERAFDTSIHFYDTPRGTLLSIAEQPRIPPALSSVVGSIQGLSQHHLSSASRARPGYTACYSGVCYHYVTPADFATIYDLNPVYGSGIRGTGQTIAILGRAQVYSPDITDYESQTGLPVVVPTLTIPTNGITPPAPNDSTTQTYNGDQTEATLDVQRAHGTAPAATVDLVVSLSTQTEDGIDIAKDYAIDNAASLHINVISNSFGECEAYVAPSAIQADDTLFQQAAAEGVTVIGITGDAGAAGCDPYNATPPSQQVISPNYLCASGYVTCLGGTDFNDATNPSQYWGSTNSSTLGSALGYIPEGAWNEPEANGKFYAQSTGGGVSGVIATPYWQTGTGVPGAAGRYTPDIAFTSAGHDGYYGCYAAGGGDCSANYFEYFYGTSAAAPSMAGVAALLNQQLGHAQGNLNPTIYSLAAVPGNAVFHDSTISSSGVTNCVVSTPSICNNSTPAPASLTGGAAGYLLQTGFDLVTGWGSVDAANLLSHWSTGGPANTATTLAITPGTTIAVGTTATLSAHVTGAGSGITGNVQFVAGTTVIGTAPVTSGVATLAASTVGVPAGSYPIQAKYLGTATHVPSISATTTVTLSNAASMTSLSANPTSVTPPGSVVFTATVSSNAGSVGGSVIFYYGSLEIGSAPVNAGRAVFTASSSGLPAGVYGVHAVYSGTGTVPGSTSGNVNVTVR